MGDAQSCQLFPFHLNKAEVQPGHYFYENALETCKKQVPPFKKLAPLELPPYLKPNPLLAHKGSTCL